MLDWISKTLFFKRAKVNPQSATMTKVDSKHVSAVIDESMQTKAKGDAYLEQGDIRKAGECYRKAIAINPQFAKAHSNLGYVLRELGNLADAENCLRRAIEIDPSNVDTNYMLGTLAVAMGKLDLAEEHFRAALRIAPDFEFAYQELSRMLVQRGQIENALEVMLSGVAQNPHNAEMRFCLGEMYQELQQFDTAKIYYKQALDIQPEYPEAITAIAISLVKQGQAEKSGNWFVAAIESYRRVIAKNPLNEFIHFNLGSVLISQNRCKEAIESFNAALAINPRFNEAKLGRSLMSLLTGEFETGWRDYDCGSQDKHVSSYANYLLPHVTNIAEISGKTIVLFSDQGLGDVVHFIRYVGELKDLGAKEIYVDAPPQIRSLLKKIPGVSGVLEKGQAITSCDYVCSLSRLPYAFITRLDSIPAKTPYLTAPLDRVEYWKERLGQYTSPRVGIVWAGNRMFKNDFNRSIKLETLSAIFANQNIQFFSLQKAGREGDTTFLSNFSNVVDLDSDMTDLSETAAIIANLDLIISVDTVVAHLAGALGMPVWIMIPFAPDFRWLLERTDSPWYPSAQLFRQPKIGDWVSVFEEVQLALEGIESSSISRKSNS